MRIGSEGVLLLFNNLLSFCLGDIIIICHFVEQVLGYAKALRYFVISSLFSHTDTIL